MSQMSSMNFSWVLPGSLAGARGPANHRQAAFLKEQGIRTVVRMDHTTISMEPWQVRDIYECVPDLTAPPIPQIHRIITLVRDEIETLGHPVAVTCRAGRGRTGTILACYLLGEGYRPEQAIAQVRTLRPKSLQNQKQQEAVRKYAEYLRLSTSG